jgi:hypothetical protein
MRLRSFDVNRPVESFKTLLRDLMKGYQFDIVGLYRKDSTVLPLPRESSVVGKVIEISINDYLRRRLLEVASLDSIQASSDRVYPDVSFSGSLIYPFRFALDIKCARVGTRGDRTESAITIGTFDAEYFRHPDEKVGNIMAPYSSYTTHLALIALYKYADATARDLELLVVEKWRVATRKRSSGTRCYIAATSSIAALRAERGGFETEEEFSAYWREMPMDEGKQGRWKAKRESVALKRPRLQDEPPGLFGDD